jgi:hypothetical protein
LFFKGIHACCTSFNAKPSEAGLAMSLCKSTLQSFLPFHKRSLSFGEGWGEAFHNTRSAGSACEIKKEIAQKKKMQTKPLAQRF